MRTYNVIKPENEHALSDELRQESLSNRVLRLTVQEELDEFSLRRKGEASPEEVDFHVEAIHLDRPTMIMGKIAVEGALRAARIDALDEHEDDRENMLRLIVASDN